MGQYLCTEKRFKSIVSLKKKKKKTEWLDSRLILILILFFGNVKYIVWVLELYGELTGLINFWPKIKKK